MGMSDIVSCESGLPRMIDAVRKLVRRPVLKTIVSGNLHIFRRHYERQEVCSLQVEEYAMYILRLVVAHQNLAVAVTIVAAASTS